MQVTNQERTGFAAEIKLIAPWAWTLAAIAFITMQVVFNVIVAHQHDAPPAWARPLLGTLVGVVLALYLLLLGYVNRDAGRRGMSRTLWTLVCALVPNAFGFILYFILRQPIAAACPQCGCAVQHGFNFCPQCNYKLSPSCPQCQHMVRQGDTYCSYCGNSLARPSAAPPFAHPSAG